MSSRPQEASVSIEEGEPLVQSQPVTLLAAGTIVRFRVRHADGRSGSSWSVQTARGSGDVYVCHREGAQTRCRYGRV